jgi:hypothetical protein
MDGNKLMIKVSYLKIKYYYLVVLSSIGVYTITCSSMRYKLNLLILWFRKSNTNHLNAETSSYKTTAHFNHKFVAIYW